METCYLARNVLQEAVDGTSLHKADVLSVIGEIYIGSGAARSDKGIMVVEQRLRLGRNTLNKRKETDEEYQDNDTRVLNTASIPACCWIEKSDWKKGEIAINKFIAMSKRSHTTTLHPYGFAKRFANDGQAAADQDRSADGIERAGQTTNLQRAAFYQERHL